MQSKAQISPAQVSPVFLSQQFLLAYRHGQHEKASSIAVALETVDLQGQLPQHDHRIAFWVNCYNAFMQHVLRQKPELWGKDALYTSKLFYIAHQHLSFDDIEHGILRGGQYKYGFGFVPSLFFSSFVKKMMVKKPDCRIHFALNCGAKSCPPIAFYSAEKLEEELNMATQAYLEAHTVFNEEQNTVYLSKLMLWFSGDFGGPWGVKRLLKKYKIIPQLSNPSLRFSQYDWGLELDNWK